MTDYLLGVLQRLRIGTGLDFHAFEKHTHERRLVLGGVEIPFEKGLLGHSDGDALAHAVTDALLGAARMGDIGKWFPPNDPRYKDADSLGLLREVVEALREEGWRTVNVDTTILTQQPRLADHVASMQERLAAVLDIPSDAVSVKASTADRLGSLGRGEGVFVHAVALILRRS